MKYIYTFVFLFFCLCSQFVQSQNQEQRIQKIESTLDSLSNSISGLSKKVDFSVSNTELSTFIRAIAKNNKVNVSIDPALQQIKVSHNFSDATVKNVLLYLCKEYNLTIDFLGTILSVKKYSPPYVPRDIGIVFDKEKDLFSVNLQNDTLHVAFKKITDFTGKNLVFAPGIGNQTISSYIKEKTFESAIDKIAFSNNLSVTKTKDNYYLFETADAPNQKGITDTRRQKPARYRNSNFYFKVQDTIKQIIDVDFENVAIASIVKDIGFDLSINMFTSTPLTSAGNATVKATNITYDVLLAKILENTKFSYSKIDNIYYFGLKNQASLTNSVTIPLLHRSIEIMNSPIQNNQNSDFNNRSSQTFNRNQNFSNQNYNQNNQFSNRNNSVNQNLNSRGTFQDYSNNTDALLDLIPKKIKDSLSITTDVEQNAFIVNGNTQKIESFRKFLKSIDKPVPVILIEVMIIEVSNSNSVSIGLDLGLGDSPAKDKGTVFPNTEVTLGSSSINKIIGGLNGFGSLNVGKVVPNFYAKIKALETNGDLKIRSTPKLSTLNGHQATLSRGERSYYAVTQRDIIGSQNPQISDVKNYYPIDANLSIGIKPLVSGDGNITLSINVLQSSFNGERIDPEAPPGMDSREFTSTIRVKDKDVIILGGIEETSKNNSGSGVPFLARIPLIKWLFSKRTRKASKSKLSVLIKPTIIN
ncbi:type II secretion system protein GspD [Polaribacter cellanae]|uniref:General secretion pathway protein GspD n=1 Tax=Polaribacter cellanae TaxID=2818493 RepID=A0A975CMA6_9FLAO|nr:type II and III secretion system protein [Polaribacter cellanae]QTE21140.1 general secretion pathway protein GspD [Polaribacter cellanae]